MGDRQKYDRGVVKEGFLGKAKLNMVSQLFSKKGKNGVFLRWNHGYWVLRDSLLFEGYKSGSKSSKDLTKTFNLNHCENVNVCNFAGSKKTLFAFRLTIYSHGAAKDYLFSAETERERDAWVETIVDLCDLSPDDENYEWLDFNYTPNDRKLMTTKKEDHAPPLPPLPWQLNAGTTMGTPERARMKPPIGMYASGSAEELNKIGGVGSYGFLSTMSRDELNQPPSLPPHNRPLMPVPSQDNSDDDDDDIDEYEEGVFEPVHFPGQGGKGQLFDQQNSSLVKASFSRSALERPPIRPPTDRPPPLPAPKWTHPADRPPMPIPGNNTSAPLSSTPSRQPPSAVIRPMLTREPLVPVSTRELPGHTDTSELSKQRPPPPPPTSAKPGHSKVSPPPPPVGSKPLPFVQPPAGGGVPLPIPPRMGRESSSTAQPDGPRGNKMSVPVSGRAADVITRLSAASDRLDHGQGGNASSKMAPELERILNKRRDGSSAAEPLQVPDRQARKVNEGRPPLTPPSARGHAESSALRTSQAPPRSSKHTSPPPLPDVSSKPSRLEENTDDSGVCSDSGMDQTRGYYYNADDLHTKSPPRTTGLTHSYHRSFEEVTQTPPSPAPNFPTPSPSWSEISSGSPAGKTAFGKLSDDSTTGNSETLDGRNIFSKKASPANEPVYVNWPVPEDVKRELEHGSSSPSPPPVPARRYSDDETESRKKPKAVSRGKSAAAADQMAVNAQQVAVRGGAKALADRVPLSSQPVTTRGGANAVAERVNPQPVTTRGGANAVADKVNPQPAGVRVGMSKARSKDYNDIPEGKPPPNPPSNRKPPPATNKKPQQIWSEQPKVGSKPTPAASPAVSASASSKDDQTRAGIAGKIAMFQNM